MNLPAHRRIQFGRTHSSMYRPENFVAVERHKRSVFGDAAVAIVLGVIGAALLFWGLS